MALSADRNTPRQGEGPFGKFNYPVKASTKIYQGAIVVLASGLAAGGTAASSKTAVGVACAQADNSSGADSAISVEVLEGVFKFGNNAAGSDPVVAGDIGGLVYIEDDANVCHTASGKSAAGRCVALDSTGVWVKVALPST